MKIICEVNTHLIIIDGIKQICVFKGSVHDALGVHTVVSCWSDNLDDSIILFDCGDVSKITEIRQSIVDAMLKGDTLDFRMYKYMRNTDTSSLNRRFLKREGD